jgi:isocitrate dehydrogenase
VAQFVEEGHLRWDSLGEYLATAVGFEALGESTGSDQAKVLGEALNKAVGRVLDNRKSPSRKVNEIDNRATNFYIALYWAEYVPPTRAIGASAAGLQRGARGGSVRGAGGRGEQARQGSLLLRERSWREERASA